jgi:hypothetical protein
MFCKLRNKKQEDGVDLCGYARLVYKSGNFSSLKIYTKYVNKMYRPNRPFIISDPLCI